jgi:hypothetical protein
MFARELHVHHGTDDLCNFSRTHVVVLFTKVKF